MDINLLWFIPSGSLDSEDLDPSSVKDELGLAVCAAHPYNMLSAFPLCFKKCLPRSPCLVLTDDLVLQECSREISRVLHAALSSLITGVTLPSIFQLRQTPERLSTSCPYVNS